MGPQIRRLISALPAEPGVYRFRDETGRVLYVGRATELRARVASYWGALKDRRHLRRMVPRVARIEAVACDSVHEAAWLERNLLEHSKPRWNRTAGGQEIPAYLMLDTRPSTAGVRLTHVPEPEVTGVSRFGPYLGGVRTRLTVSALHRVHPLAYTRKGLTGAERDMAAQRGVTADDRDELARAVAAVLLREPVAVATAQETLARVRDRAADSLAFELAGRVQDEARALAWVTAAQRVTSDGAGDFAVQGWADGVLVSFTVRDGRVRTWTQRHTSRPAAPPPPGWEGFARRNAELAARLATVVS
ncbi:GIY-YIG nuclease family protein [Actinoplanes sp. NPDC051494]|uniref:GIY-YIG nuclease family protein n=1 Tax=Actinoplanes sp. NPDC051494 TaxID=3363907 RepID=UPI0037964897